MASFIDSAEVTFIAGNGGNGIASILREKFKPLGGPNGGDGGNGGSIILKATDRESSLLDFHFNKMIRAKNGSIGQGGFKDGKTAPDLILNIPIGTIIYKISNDKTILLKDFTYDGEEWTIAKGGKGGLGNSALASKSRKAPGFALLGEEGQSVTVKMELKLLADVALVGFPSSGKSSIISSISSSRAKIADYPFTTLKPNLGVVLAKNGYKFIAADVPGLIPGASEGKGLGLEFLKHIERCSIICHVIDLATYESTRSPYEDYLALESELEHYSKSIDEDTLSKENNNYIRFAERQRIIIFNKIDTEDADVMVDMSKAEFKKLGFPTITVSAKDHLNLEDLKLLIAKYVKETKDIQNEKNAPGIPTINPLEDGSYNNRMSYKKSNQSYKHTVVKVEDNVFALVDSKIYKLCMQTNFDNDEAVGYLSDRIASSGMEVQLLEAGAQTNDTILIHEGTIDDDQYFEFEFMPEIEAGAEKLFSFPRGDDGRILDYKYDRKTRRQKGQLETSTREKQKSLENRKKKY